HPPDTRSPPRSPSSPTRRSSDLKQYRLTSTASGTIGSADAGTTITGLYNTQFLVTFSQTGIGGDTTATVVTVDAAAKTAANLPLDRNSTRINTSRDGISTPVASC